MAVPRIGPLVPGGGHGGAALPEPLPPSVAQQIRQIFALQARGALDEAATLTAALTDTTLNGHILADRYLNRFDHSSAAELATWLARYPDHPDASAVHSALLARLPRGAAAPPAPAPLPATPDAPTPEEAEPADFRLVRNPLLDRTIRERAHAGNADSALHLLSRTPGLDPLYGSELRAEIARALFTQGRDPEALRLAETALRQSQGRIGLAAYVGGLAAWRLDRIDLAQPLFERASRAELAPAAVRAGASFWAARAHLRNRDPAGYAPWMRRASESRRTFYGLLARRTLGLGTDLSPTRETLGFSRHGRATGHAAGLARLCPAASGATGPGGGGTAAALGHGAWRSSAQRLHPAGGRGGWPDGFCRRTRGLIAECRWAAA